MMILLRVVFGALLLAGIACFVLSITTGQPVWRRRGLVIIKWTVFAALGFFAVLMLQRVGDLF